MNFHPSEPHQHFNVIQNEEGYIPDDNLNSHLTIKEAFKDAIERAEHYRDGLAISLNEPSVRSEDETGKLLETLDYDIGLLKIASSCEDITNEGFWFMFQSGDLVISINRVNAIWCIPTYSP